MRKLALDCKEGRVEPTKIEDNGIWRSVTMLKYIEDVVGQLDV